MPLTLASTVRATEGAQVQEAGLAVEGFYGRLWLRRSFLHGPSFLAGLYFPEVGVPGKRETAVGCCDG